MKFSKSLRHVLQTHNDQQCAYAENSSEEDLASFTPSFLWLLRDFYLSLEEEGHSVELLLFVSQQCTLASIFTAES